MRNSIFLPHLPRVQPSPQSHGNRGEIRQTHLTPPVRAAWVWPPEDSLLFLLKAHFLSGPASLLITPDLTLALKQVIGFTNYYFEIRRHIFIIRKAKTHEKT